MSRDTIGRNTWLSDILSVGDERWAASLIRRVTGVEEGHRTRDATEEYRERVQLAQKSAIKEIYDEDESITKWRLHKENVKAWLDANAPAWWAGGARLGCQPRFFLMAFGG